MNTLGGVSLEVVVWQPLCSTLAEQQPKQDPPWKNEPVGMEICAFSKGQQQSLTFCLVMPTLHMNKWCSALFQDPLLNLKLQIKNNNDFLKAQFSSLFTSFTEWKPLPAWSTW